jgi:hypothetical protein
LMKIVSRFVVKIFVIKNADWKANQIGNQTWKNAYFINSQQNLKLSKPLRIISLKFSPDMNSRLCAIFKALEIL